MLQFCSYALEKREYNTHYTLERSPFITWTSKYPTSRWFLTSADYSLVQLLTPRSGTQIHMHQALRNLLHGVELWRWRLAVPSSVLYWWSEIQRCVWSSPLLSEQFGVLSLKHTTFINIHRGERLPVSRSPKYLLPHIKSNGLALGDVNGPCFLFILLFGEISKLLIYSYINQLHHGNKKCIKGI